MTREMTRTLLSTLCSVNPKLDCLIRKRELSHVLVMLRVHLHHLIAELF
jgi:hypothetical protein